MAPIEKKPRDTVILPELSCRVPLKPISGSTRCSRTRLRRERLTWGSQRSGATRGGSEDSASSSSSIDLETEEDDGKTLCNPASGENQFKHAGKHYPDNVSCAEADAGSWRFDVQSRTTHIPPMPRFTLGQHTAAVNKAIKHFDSERNRDLHCENKANDTDYVKEPNDSQLLTKCINFHEDDVSINERTVNIPTKGNRVECQTTELKTEISRDATYNLKHDQVLPISSSKGISISDQQHVKPEEISLEDCCAHKSMPSGRENALQIAQERNLPNVTAVKLPQSEINFTRKEQTLEVQHPVQGKERRRSKTCRQKANIQTDPQSFNILANKDQSMPNRNPPKCLQKNSSPSMQVKDKTRKNPELIINGDKSCTKVKEKLKVVKGSQCDDGKKDNPASLGSASDQKYQAVKEPKGGQLCKRPGVAGKPRPQSALDFITYKDMFQQIQSSDKGPAIYEMFAGPIYDNLRVSSSCDKVKVRQVQSAKVTNTAVKKAQRTAAVVKAKPKPASTRTRSNRASSEIDKLKKPSGTKPHGSLEAESPHSEHVDEKVLSTIEECFSGHGTVMVRSSEKTQTEATLVQSVYPEGSCHMQVQDANNNSSVKKQDQSPAPCSQASQQLKINTWTLSSSSDINPVSPVYKEFLDEIGDSPFTDDLLQCLAEKLISLDERDTSLDPCPAMREPQREEQDRNDAPSVPRFSEVHSCFCLSRNEVHDHISLHRVSVGFLSSMGMMSEAVQRGYSWLLASGSSV